MKCANCGSTDLYDEGDLLYCRRCRHRTQKATGKDDLIRCPYCGRLKDRTAYACWWCNSSEGSYPLPSRELYERYERENAEFEKTLTPADIIYWNIRENK